VKSSSEKRYNFKSSKNKHNNVKSRYDESSGNLTSSSSIESSCNIKRNDFESSILNPSTLEQSDLKSSTLKLSNPKLSNLKPSNLKPSNLKPSNLKPSNLKPSDPNSQRFQNSSEGSMP